MNNDEKEIYDLLESDALDNARLSKDAFSVYNFEGRPVPRVTKIIDDVMNMQREEFAMPYTFHLHEGENTIRLHMFTMLFTDCLQHY